jgi:hypothetical protein
MQQRWGKLQEDRSLCMNGTKNEAAVRGAVRCTRLCRAEWTPGVCRLQGRGCIDVLDDAKAYNPRMCEQCNPNPNAPISAIIFKTGKLGFTPGKC